MECNIFFGSCKIGRHSKFYSTKLRNSLSCAFNLILLPITPIDHVTIGDRAIFACYTVAMKNLPGGKTYSGSPAREVKEKNRRDATFVEVKILKNKIKKFELEYLNKQ
jgi:hypothetical protein